MERGRQLHEGVGGDDGELVPDGEVDGPGGRIEVECEELLAGLDVPELCGLVGAAGDEAHGVTRHVAAPNGAVVAAVGAQTLAVVGEPHGGIVVLSAREEKVAVPVVLQERQRPLVPFHQYRPHLSLNDGVPHPLSLLPGAFAPWNARF